MSELPMWTLTEADAASLAPAFDVSAFEIRPPSNFRFITHMAETNGYLWVGPVRDDETYTHLAVIVTTLPPEFRNDTLDEMLEVVLGSIKARRTQWSQAKPEHGRIGDLPFIRTTWRGIATAPDAHEGLQGRMMHGVVYLGVHGAEVIQVMCQDVVPYHGEALHFGEKTALSVRIAPVAGGNR